MVSLMRYSIQAVENHLLDLHRNAEAGQFDPNDVSESIAGVLVRDDDGNFWRFNVDQSRWLLRTGDRWDVSEAIPEAVEGCAPLTRWYERESYKHSDMLASFIQGVSPASLQFPQILGRLVQGVRKAYGSGAITTDEAEELLRDQYIVSLDGGVWTIGVRSGDWYRAEVGTWNQVSRNPDPDTFFLPPPLVFQCEVCGDESEDIGICPACGEGIIPRIHEALNEAVISSVEMALIGIESLPESVSSEWNPPLLDASPAASAQLVCPTCQAVNLPNSRYCSQCGSGL